MKTIIFTIILLLSSNLYSEEIVSESTAKEWGYKTVGSFSVNQSEWEKETFGEAKVFKQKIKSLKPTKEGSYTYYRFTITREIYKNEKIAQERVEKLKRLFPPGTNTKKFPDLVLCEGFTINSSVYTLSTNVQAFTYEELPRVLSLLKEKLE